MNGIRALIKEVLEGSPALLPHEDTVTRLPVTNREVGS